MAHFIKRQWLYKVLNSLRKETEIDVNHPSMTPYISSHLVAILEKSNLISIVKGKRPITIRIKGKWSSSPQYTNEYIWKSIQKKLPEGAIIQTPKQKAENEIIRWEKALVRYEPTLERQLDEQSSKTDETERDATVKQRIGQDILRKRLLKLYDNKCAMCDVDTPEVLRASHIIPWNEDIDKRLDLCNVILLCGLHDLAFEKKLITVSPEGYKIKIPSRPAGLVKVLKKITYSNLSLPSNRKFYPKKQYLKIHITSSAQ